MLHSLGEKLIVALLALLAPEFIFVWALRQWLRARSIAKECSDAASTEEAGEGRKRRSITHSTLTAADERAQFQYLEALGYEKRSSAQDERHENLREADTKESEDQSVVEISDVQTTWTTTHGFFILMGGFHVFDHDRPLFSLAPPNVIELVAMGVLVPPSEEEIKDRSKSDSFSKIIVVMQTLWFVMQSIARHIERLPITELEVATLAYTIPILGIYMCWWNKPLGVAQPIRVPKSLWKGDLAARLPFWKSFADALTGSDVVENLSRVPRFFDGHPSSIQQLQADLVASIITILFGTIHRFAWEFYFPSDTEQLLWRIASLVMMASPVVWVTFFSFAAMRPDTEGGLWVWILILIMLLSAIAIPIYLAGRIILLVLAVIGLRSLPSATYETVYWTTFIPHV